MFCPSLKASNFACSAAANSLNCVGGKHSFVMQLSQLSQMQLSHKVGVASFNETHLTSSLCWRDPWGICCLLTNNGPGVELTQKFASNSDPRPFPGFPHFPD